MIDHTICVMENPRENGRFLSVSIRIFCLVLAAQSLPSTPLALAEESHPGMNTEVLYSEAVLALSRKQTDQAVSILDQLLDKDPRNIQALELKALTLKNEGKEPQAIETYKKLIQLKPYREQGPYQFELGMIYQRQKNDALAKYHFEMALRLRFNATVTRFFLGLIEFNHQRYRPAGYYFLRVSREGDGDLKLISHYYLGLIELKLGFSLGGTRNLQVARNLAAETPADPTAQEIQKSADQILSPFNHGQWFANVSVLGQYDSNVGQVSTSLAASGQNSGMKTAKTTLSAGFGRMSAPLKTFQLVGNYRLDMNKNFNSETRNYEFVSNSASLFINYLPLSPSQGGLKIQGNFIFQNQLQDGGSASDPNARYAYGKYNLSAEIGPYFRYQPSRMIKTELDIYFRPQKYYTDDDLTGSSVFTRVSANLDRESRFFNPGASLSFENDSTHSSEFKATTIGMEISNSAHPTPVDALNASIGFLSSKYPESSFGREDKNLAFQITDVHSFSSRWSLLAELAFTRNISTVYDSYTYNEFTSSMGVSWSL